MNPKLQKVIREIERAKAKIEELQALLPELERHKKELENAEIIKVFRSADVTPADFAAFIAAYKAQTPGGAAVVDTTARQTPAYTEAAPQENHMEEPDDE